MKTYRLLNYLPSRAFTVSIYNLAVEELNKRKEIIGLLRKENVIITKTINKIQEENYKLKEETFCLRKEVQKKMLESKQ